MALDESYCEITTFLRSNLRFCQFGCSGLGFDSRAYLGEHNLSHLNSRDLRRELLRNKHLFKDKFKLFDSLDANNSLAISLSDIKFRRFIGMGKVYSHAKLQLHRRSNKRVMRL